MAFNRQSDNPHWTTLTLFGLILILSGVLLTAFKMVPPAYGLGWALLGALMVRPDKVVDLVRAWRGKTDGGA